MQFKSVQWGKTNDDISVLLKAFLLPHLTYGLCKVELHCYAQGHCSRTDADIHLSCGEWCLPICCYFKATLSESSDSSASCCLQMDWLHCSLLHGGSGPGLQLPGPAVWHPGLRQARLTYDTRLHLQHGRNDAHGVSQLLSQQALSVSRFKTRTKKMSKSQFDVGTVHCTALHYKYFGYYLFRCW